MQTLETQQLTKTTGGCAPQCVPICQPQPCYRPPCAPSPCHMPPQPQYRWANWGWQAGWAQAQAPRFRSWW